MSDLFGSQIKDIYGQWLQIGSGNVGLTASFQTVQDGKGNNSVLQLSTTAIKVNATTVTINGQTLTLTGTSSISGTHTGTSSGTNTGDQIITLTGDVTGSGTGSFAASIANNAVVTDTILDANVTYAKIQNVTNNRLLGNNSGSAGPPQEISVGTGLSLSGGTLSNSAAAAAISQVNVQIFTSTGAYTYTPTSGMKYIIFEMCGAGGGGGGVSNAGAFAASGGGNGGGYFKGYLTSAQLNGSATGSIGALGTGGAAGNNNGAAGGNTTFIPNAGSTWTAVGGAAGAGIAGSASPNGSSGAAQTTNTAGTGTVILNFTGQRSTEALSITGFGIRGMGGKSPLGMHQTEISIASSGSRAGNLIAFNPIGYGIGGAGALNVNSSTDAPGGNGTNGVLIIYEFI